MNGGPKTHEEQDMHLLKDFLVNFFILAIISALPFILFPQLIVSINELGIGLLVPILLVILIIILAIPSTKRQR